MTRARRILGLGLIVALLLLAFVGGWLMGRLAIGAVVNPASLSDFERQFTERMRDVSLVGTFSTVGSDRPPRPERYDIDSVEKVGEDKWRFNARMRGYDHSIPIVVPMRWNGDTPMIMMTDTNLLGLGTFSVRLFFYGDRYAGTWQNLNSGGLMSGRIEKQTHQTR